MNFDFAASTLTYEFTGPNPPIDDFVIYNGFEEVPDDKITRTETSIAVTFDTTVSHNWRIVTRKGNEESDPGIPDKVTSSGQWFKLKIECKLLNYASYYKRYYHTDWSSKLDWRLFSLVYFTFNKINEDLIGQTVLVDP